MSTRKLCGFDVNGWRDFAARNWRSVPGEDDEIGPVEIGRCGPLSSVVSVSGGKDQRWIGGRQADDAPHGLGGGWGQIGAVDRRKKVLELLKQPSRAPKEIQAAFQGLASGASINVVSIDDNKDMDEERQESILASLVAGRFRQTMLVWRPVLAALYAIEHGFVASGATIGIICHSADGFAVQRLRLKETGTKLGRLLAPERRSFATSVPNNLGYETLLELACKQALAGETLNARTEHRLKGRSTAKLALGLPNYSEILRRQNGEWEVLDLEDSKCFPDQPFLGEFPSLEGCEQVLFETVTDGPVRKELLSFLKHSVTHSIQALPAHSVSEGALVAARRVDLGEPVYFDFLPKLSTIVFHDGEPSSFDLINDKDTVEAGRTYRSPRPAELAIPSGHTAVSVFLRKETAPHPRKAIVDIGPALPEPSPVSLWVEQKPAAGRAKIIMEASLLGRQFTVDWENAQEDKREWSEIIRSLEMPPPSIPKRLVLKCGSHPWENGSGGQGMLGLLKSQLRRSEPNWTILAAQLSARPFREYCISSDGDIPVEAGFEAEQLLDIFTEKAVEVADKRRQGLEPGNNDVLKFLTWQFKRCPDIVAEWLLECIKTRSVNGRAAGIHPFVQHAMSWVLIYQGLGRVTGTKDLEKRVISTLLRTNLDNWNWRQESACMAFLLSRSDTAPLHLDRSGFEKLVRRNIGDFRDSLGTEYTKFNYAPFLLAGLLRWRLKQPDALLLGKDPLAVAIKEAVEQVERDMNGRRRVANAFERKRSTYLPILANLKDELKGAGGNPDLLLDIYNA